MWTAHSVSRAEYAEHADFGVRSPACILWEPSCNGLVNVYVSSLMGWTLNGMVEGAAHKLVVWEPNSAQKLEK